jgi:branched-chain amino acid transport system permease protein
MISGFFAGLAGSLFTLVSRAVNPAFYQPLYSFYAIIMASIGGIATISGSIIGAFIFVYLSEQLRPLAALALLIFATILILIVRFAEEGMMRPLGERLEEFWDIIRGR